MDDVTGESYLPAEKFSNFALHLATMYKGESQGVIQSTFKRLYDLIQGVQEENLFEKPDNTPRTLAQAIYETLNIIYDRKQRSDVLAGDSSASQRGRQGSEGNAATGERIEKGERTADRAGSVEGDSGRSRDKGKDRGNQSEETTTPQNVGTSLFQYFTGTLSELISQAKQSAEGLIKKVIAPVSSRLKEDLSAKGIVIDEEYKHVIDNNAIRHTLKKHSGKNEEKRGQVPIVDADFDRIADVVEHYDGVEVLPGNTTAQRIIYQKAYPDGTVMFVEEQRVGRKELAAVTMWKKKNLTLTDANRTETTQISDLNEVPDSKDTTNPPTTNELGEKNAVSSAQKQVEAAEAEVNTNPTDAQKKAGNYKKGHIQVGTFDITIENPKGSVRSGVDAGGNKWETIMRNTYGYIRGTEGVDGDHIDVFLSDDIDGWGGLEKVFNERSNHVHQGRNYWNEPTLENKKLRQLLGEKAYQEAVMSANRAYYTPAYIVDTLWDIAEKMGFEGGSVLEGSAGIGNILGQMPGRISERSDIHAIEIDGTSGGILSLLYPDAKVCCELLTFLYL